MKNKTKTKKAAAKQVDAVADKGNAEASGDAIALDSVRAAAAAGNESAINILAAAGMAAFVECEDKITCTADSTAWNANSKNTVEVIELFKPAGNLLAQFDYVITPQVHGGKITQRKDGRVDVIGAKLSRECVLECSDNGMRVGQPFNPKTYSLLGTAGFQKQIERICAVLDKLGLKYHFVTSGLLMNRERMFMTIKIDDDSLTTLKLDNQRQFQQFLNCLNSIPSNNGCTVTFANNSFCVCCRNTFSHCLHGADGAEFHAAVKHTSNMTEYLVDVPKLVECFFTSNKALFKTLKAFHAYPVTAADVEGYFAAFIGRDAKGEMTDKTELSVRSENIVTTLKSLFYNGNGNKGETALDLFQAVTDYYSHFSAGKSDNPFKQFMSSEIGDGAMNKGTFYTWLVRSIQDKSGIAAVARVGDTILVNSRAKR